MKWKLIFFCLTSLHSFAQADFAFRNFTVESGLPSNTIYETFQDDKGYVYVGHNNGCSIFNGISFHTPISNSKTSALSSFISFANGQIMCRNFQGKKFIYKNNKLTLFETSLKESWGFPTFLQDGEKHYMFQSESFYTLEENGKGDKIDLGIDISRIYHGIVKDNRAYLFVSNNTNSILLCFDVKLKKVISSKEFDHGSNVVIYKYPNGIVWIDNVTGATGIYDNGFIGKTNIYHSVIPKDSKITDFCELKNGDKLLSTFNGVYRLDKNWHLKNHYLAGIQCTHLMIDSDRALWVSSLQNGLFYVPDTDVIQINSSSVSGRNVKFSKVYAHDNFMYVGTYDGRILKFDKKGDLVHTYDFQRSVEIQSIFVSKNELFAFCGGLLIVDLNTGSIKKEWYSSACKSIFVRDNQLIFGTSKGLLIKENDVLSTELDTLWLKKAFPIGENQFLLEAVENVLIFNRTKNELKQLQIGGSDVCSLGNKFYYRTANSVYELDTHLKVKRIYTSESNITQLYVSDNALILDLDNNGSIALHGNNFSKITRLPFYSLHDNLFAGEIGGYRFNGNNNSIILIPKDLKLKSKAPNLRLVVENGNFSIEKDTYVLPHRENNLTFEFDILPNYQYSGEGELYYRLVELNSEWKKAVKSDRYNVEYLRIPPGDYTLEVYAESGGNHSAISRYKIKVKEPFYTQWWFFILLVLFTIVIMYSFSRWRAKIIQAKNIRVLHEQELKTKALNSELVAIRSQMNPHFIFNSLSSIQTKILNEDRVEAYKNVNTFATLLRQALQFTSKEFITLADELDFTHNYILLEQNRTANAFEFKEEIDDTISLGTTMFPALFLQPFIENAIRHGLMHSKNNKLLTLNIKSIPDGFRVIIEDNGIGRLAANEINKMQRPDHVSFATKAIQDRIDILSETNKMKIDLNIEDLEIGTRIVINFHML